VNENAENTTPALSVGGRAQRHDRAVILSRFMERQWFTWPAAGLAGTPYIQRREQ
jgi:hypothetical protein